MDLGGEEVQLTMMGKRGDSVIFNDGVLGLGANFPLRLACWGRRYSPAAALPLRGPVCSFFQASRSPPSMDLLNDRLSLYISIQMRTFITSGGHVRAICQRTDTVALR